MNIFAAHIIKKHPLRLCAMAVKDPGRVGRTCDEITRFVFGTCVGLIVIVLTVAIAAGVMMLVSPDTFRQWMSRP